MSYHIYSCIRLYVGLLSAEASEKIILQNLILISDGRQYLYSYGTNAGDFKMSRRTEVTAYPLSPPLKIGCNTYNRICVSLQQRTQILMMRLEWQRTMSQTSIRIKLAIFTNTSIETKKNRKNFDWEFI